MVCPTASGRVGRAAARRRPVPLGGAASRNLVPMGKKSRRDRTQSAPKRKEVPFVERPFEGLDHETDLVAMREILPSATISTTYKDTDVLLATLLPDQVPAVRRQDGSVVVALQFRLASGDASRDVANALLQALELEPGEPLYLSELPEPGERLQDLLGDAPLNIEVHDGFDFWIDPAEERTPELEEALANAKEQVVPMVKVDGVESAYWTRMGKEFLRWVRPEGEYELLNALARLQAAHETDLEEGVRMIGAFRAQGLLVPVWELQPGTEADELTGPCQAFEKRLQKALKDDSPLTAEERGARAGLISRQVNL